MERVHLNPARPVASHASVTYLPDCVFICINRNEAKISPILRIRKREGCAACTMVARCSFRLTENQHAVLVILK